MKKTLILLTLSALLISACSLFEGKPEPTPLPPTPTPMPTATPDPCAPENLMDELQEFVNLINVFRGTANAAGVTEKPFMIIPILEMQRNMREIEEFDVPACEEPIKLAMMNYMVASTNVYTAFMSADTTEEDDAAREALTNIEQSLWQSVLFEINKLLTDKGLVQEIASEIGETQGSEVFTGVTIINEGSNRINIRSIPDLNGEIISNLEPGMQAIGIARTEAGDWLQINLDGVIGWVFTETVTASAATQDLPVFEPVQ